MIFSRVIFSDPRILMLMFSEKCQETKLDVAHDLHWILKKWREKIGVNIVK